MHKVAVLALNGVVTFDLGIPIAIFGFVKVDNVPVYEVVVCSEGPTVSTRHLELHLEASLDALSNADTIIVPGIYDPLIGFSPELLDALRASAERGARIASICSGTFVLAAAGLLDGRRATTHWHAAEMFTKLYPRVTMDANVLFVDEGRILSSAGMSAGVDLCLHLVRSDFGQGAAAAAARFAVASLDRGGEHAQVICYEPPTCRSSLAGVLEWALSNITEPLDVETFASRAGMSMRTFLRRFREQTGVTPARWLQIARIRRAQELLESSASSIEEVARRTGFLSQITFRAQFRREVNIAPSVYRRRAKVPGSKG